MTNLRLESGSVKADITIGTDAYIISENTTLAAGQWYINQNITVNNGVTLTLQPGTTLKFAAGKSLTVNGKLNAVGTSNQKIVFTSIDTSYHWNLLKLNGSGSANSLIKYADILFATEIDVINTDGVVIQNCNIKNSAMHGINFSGTIGGPTIGNSAIDDTITNTNTAHGILVQGGAVVKCSGNK